MVECSVIANFFDLNATTCFYFQQEVLVLDEADRLLDMGFEARYTRKPLLCTTGIILEIFDKQ